MPDLPICRKQFAAADLPQPICRKNLKKLKKKLKTRIFDISIDTVAKIL
jgi:hypothetical protein